MEIQTVEREEPQRDLSVDRGLRNHIEAAIAHHRPAGPDVDLNARNITELEQATRRAREDGKDVQKFSDLRPEDRKRLQIRAAVTEVRDRAANAPTKEAFAKGGVEGAIHNQPPGTWSAEAKAEFNRLPYSVRESVLREQNYTLNSLGRLASEYGEIRKVMEPVRQLYQQSGLKSDAEAIGRLLHWEAGLRNPETRHQAYLALGRELGIEQGQQDYQQQYQQSQPMDEQTAAVYQTLERFAHDKPHFHSVRVTMGQMLEANPQAFNGPNGTDLERLYQAAVQYHSAQSAIQQTVERFSKDKPYFEKVRVQMGQLMTDHPEKYQGDENTALERAYRDACKLAGYATNSKQMAAVSPSTRSPSAAPTSTKHRSGIRGSIKDAFDEVRGRVA